MLKLGKCAIIPAVTRDPIGPATHSTLRSLGVTIKNHKLSFMVRVIGDAAEIA